jgi:hypothetical protein
MSEEPERVSSQARSPGLKGPENPYFIAGAFGGPLVIYVLTPLRNALTLASQDRVSSVFGVYSRVFSKGFQSGWTGGHWPVLPAIPQFVILGPMYHFYSSVTNPYTALVLTGMTETMFTFGANARNAEVAHNANLTASGRSITSFTPVWRFWGVGSVPHAMRNIIAMSGVRIVSDPLSGEFKRRGLFENSERTRKTVADFAASLMTGAVSMPPNQLYNYFVTSPQLKEESRSSRFMHGLQWLKTQYVQQPRIMVRDLVMRSVYASCLFGFYRSIERACVDYHHSKYSLD